ncbi:EamA family transporter [Gordonia sp. PP30]|uniref:EamA family transporter n=1 Tax=Gordonia sp. PP30 TaxID=2935861 RepID=UPI001FFF565C|nr:EamA family transporter [Gordonia sp. PP30]UQE74146.1 EamA family transporter [Gordonia sp. PP30]
MGLSLLASVLFGVTFFAAGVVDAAPEAVFGWRGVVTALCYGAVLLAAPARRRARDLIRRCAARPALVAVLIVNAVLIGVQMWLFVWAPAHGYGLDASLGYLLFPIGMVLVGRIGFTESVTAAQWTAVGIACVAVGVKLVASGSLSWLSCAVFAANVGYFALRRRFRLEGPEVFAAEVFIMAPIAVVFIALYPAVPSVSAALMVLGIGVGGTIAVSAYVAAAGLLSFPMFGLLSYAEPVGLFAASLLLGEHLDAADGVTYGLLAVALAVLAVAGFRGRGTAVTAVPLDTVTPACP